MNIDNLHLAKRICLVVLSEPGEGFLPEITLTIYFCPKNGQTLLPHTEYFDSLDEAIVAHNKVRAIINKTLLPK